MRILLLMGSEPNLTEDSNNNKLIESSKYDFSIADGSFVESKVGRYGSSHIKLLRLSATNHPKALNAITDIDDIVIDCNYILNNLITYWL